mgnify:CR=1 FL=1
MNCFYREIKSKLDKKTPLTSDEALFEISNIKNEINKRILLAVKEAAIDCSLHSTVDSKEPLVCFSFGKGDPSPSKFAISPSLSGEEARVRRPRQVLRRPRLRRLAG